MSFIPLILLRTPDNKPGTDGTSPFFSGENEVSPVWTKLENWGQTGRSLISIVEKWKTFHLAPFFSPFLCR
jgi:hypothetical protein